jgi:hypothetical protein
MQIKIGDDIRQLNQEILNRQHLNDHITSAWYFNGHIYGTDLNGHWRTELSYAQRKNRGRKMRLLGMDTCPNLNDIMEIRCNKKLTTTISTEILLEVALNTITPSINY